MVNWISRRDVDNAGAGVMSLMLLVLVGMVILALVPPVLIALGIYLIVKRAQYGAKSLIGGVAAILAAAAVITFVWVPTYVNVQYYGDLDACEYVYDAEGCDANLRDEGFTNITFRGRGGFFCDDPRVTSVPAPKNDKPRLAKKTAQVTVDFDC